MKPTATAHAVREYLPQPSEREGIALCLSGGGFRAALFHLGAFSSPEFRQIWRDGYTALRTTDEVYILGFSLPPEDPHVRFVIRSALRANEAARATPLKVSIVNPDRAVFLRFGRLVQSHINYFECGLAEVDLDDLLN